MKKRKHTFLYITKEPIEELTLMWDEMFIGAGRGGRSGTRITKLS